MQGSGEGDLQAAEPERRAEAVRTLAESSGAAAADALRQALEDPDERVRAAAAVGLAQVGDPGALDALIRTIDDAPDPMHLDSTPAVGALGAMGSEAVPPLLDLLESSEQLTRLHAQRALELAVYRRHGFVPGRGFPNDEAEEAAREELTSSDYRFDAEPAARAAAIERLRERFNLRQAQS
jgi:HEAT repeat protein